MPNNDGSISVAQFGPGVAGKLGVMMLRSEFLRVPLDFQRPLTQAVEEMFEQAGSDEGHQAGTRAGALILLVEGLAKDSEQREISPTVVILQAEEKLKEMLPLGDDRLFSDSELLTALERTSPELRLKLLELIHHQRQDPHRQALVVKLDPETVFVDAFYSRRFWDGFDESPEFYKLMHESGFAKGNLGVEQRDALWDTAKVFWDGSPEMDEKILNLVAIATGQLRTLIPGGTNLSDDMTL